MTHRHKTTDKIINFLIWADTCLLILSGVLIILQGFRAWGFYLEPSLLKCIEAATIGEFGGLVALILKDTVSK